MLLSCYVFLFALFSIVAGKDYYKILRVPRNANEEHVKRSFRKLALKYHPDKNKEEGAEETFRDIAEAYGVLGDKKKRAHYDRFGHASFSQNGQSGGSGFQGAGFNFDFNSFFKEFDESLKQRRQGNRHDSGTGEFKFGDGFFNFDSLWDDDDHRFFGNSQKSRDGAGSLFDFDMDDMFGGNSIFDDLQQSVHSSFHSHSSSGRGHGSSGQNCRRVTQRFGNTVTTFTQCS